jgi:3-dehydroquinate synthase
VVGKRVLVVTNTTVAPLYLEKVTWALTYQNPNVSVESVVLPDGEKYKDMVRLGFSAQLAFSFHFDVL